MTVNTGTKQRKAASRKKMKTNASAILAANSLELVDHHDFEPNFTEPKLDKTTRS
jgi:hypothetical protein